MEGAKQEIHLELNAQELLQPVEIISFFSATSFASHYTDYFEVLNGCSRRLIKVKTGAMLSLNKQIPENLALC